MSSLSETARTLPLAGLLLLVAIAASIVLVGCSSPTDEQLVREDAETRMDAIKSIDGEFLEEFQTHLPLDDFEAFGVDVREFMEAYLEGFDYTVNSVRIDGDTATANIGIVCKSYSGWVAAQQNAAEALRDDPTLSSLSDEEISARLGEIIMSSIIDTQTVSASPVEIAYERSNDDEWLPAEAPDGSVINAMLNS